MNIKMAGIDFNHASIENREHFALTHAAQAAMLHVISGKPGVLGCVVINTCNRMELWLSCEENHDIAPYDLLCDHFHADPEVNKEFFTERAGKEAICHLYELACGLKSMIFGEEQILAQVKESIAFARECKTSDAVLQALFRSAVTAAKKAKTEVHLQAVDRSAAQIAVNYLKHKIGRLHGVTCLVIGSGEMGRLAAKALISEGAHVNITLRQYKSGDAMIPTGCRAVDYEDRYVHLHDAEVVISATRSPHHTLQYEKVKELTDTSEKIMFDLALPRDIEPLIGTLPNIRLFDIDHLGDRLTDDCNTDGIARVKEIVSEAIGEFERWYSARALMPKINEISALAATDAEARLQSCLKDMPLDDGCRQRIHEATGRTIEKVVESMLLSLQKSSGLGFLSGALSETKARIADTPDIKSEAAPPRFPLFVDLSGRVVTVIGAGPIALRRIQALGSYPCSVRVVAPEAIVEIHELHAKKQIVYQNKAYETSDLDGAYLVIAATDDRSLNHRIALDAELNGQHCSIADCKEDCTFFFPATVHYDGGVIGICGTGVNHGKTKEIADGIREFIRIKEQV